MSLPSTGSISFSQINSELGFPLSQTISLNDPVVRALLGVSSGAIDLGKGFGKSSIFAFNRVISSNFPNFNLRSELLLSGWNGTTPVNAQITINSGVCVYARSTSAAALDTGTGIPSGSSITIINNGFIVGMGGAGGRGGYGLVTYQGYIFNGSQWVIASGTECDGLNGGNGGNAISVSFNTTIQNNGTIAGGGGGGGGGGLVVTINGGPGRGDDNAPTTNNYGGGGGGGRSGIDNSLGGATVVNTVNGGNGSYGQAGNGAMYGGAGGNWGASGANGSRASGTSSPNWKLGVPGTGGIGGKAVALNGCSVTWTATGTRLGLIS